MKKLMFILALAFSVIASQTLFARGKTGRTKDREEREDGEEGQEREERQEDKKREARKEGHEGKGKTDVINVFPMPVYITESEGSPSLFLCSACGEGSDRWRVIAT